MVAVEWRPVVGFPGYEVSSDGRVRSWKPIRNMAPLPKKPRFMRLYDDKDGYKRLVLFRDHARNYLRVSALVAEAWHGPRPHGHVVRHIDGSKDNDSPDNLCWGTPNENSADSRQHGTWVHGSRVNTARLVARQVRRILHSTLPTEVLADKYGVTTGTIRHIKTGWSWRHVTGLPSPKGSNSRKKKAA